jgi:hypothetical protein
MAHAQRHAQTVSVTFVLGLCFLAGMSVAAASPYLFGPGKQLLIRRPGSNGRCNTIQHIDSTMLS